MCVPFAAYYFAEARECLVTAKRDFVFYLRHAYTVSPCLVILLFASCSLYNTQEDKYVLTAMSVDFPPCPPMKGVPRAQVCTHVTIQAKQGIWSHSRQPANFKEKS